jgi:hypothetical protein
MANTAAASAIWLRLNAATRRNDSVPETLLMICEAYDHRQRRHHRNRLQQAEAAVERHLVGGVESGQVKHQAGNAFTAIEGLLELADSKEITDRQQVGDNDEARSP